MMLEPSPILLLIYIVIPVLLSALVLYVVIRFGVKHGMRPTAPKWDASPATDPAPGISDSYSLKLWHIDASFACHPSTHAFLC